MSDIRWDILGPPVDIGAAVRNGFETGRATMMRSRRDQAISALATDPNNAQAISALAAVDPESAWKFEDRARQNRIRGDVGRVLGTAQPSVLAPVQPAAPVTPDPMGGAAPAPPAAASAPNGYDSNALRRLYAEDPDTAKTVMEFIKTSTHEQREVIAAKYAAAVPLLMEAQRLPLEQRRAFIMAQAPALIQQGWTQQEIEGFDPTDQNIRGQIAVGTPLKDYQRPTAMQQNYEFLSGVDPALGTKYLHRQTDEPPFTVRNDDGTLTIIPRTSGEGGGPPAAAIEHLRQNPQLKADFDAKYGPGAADRVLSQGGAGSGGPRTF